MRTLKIALAGNPNCGKTTLFNTLTGANQHVGNWPGKTIEQKTGNFNFNGRKIELIDLPGTYSLTSFSEEEQITMDFLINEKPDITINIVDATNLERNLFLTFEVLEHISSVVILINMDKLAKEKGIIINPKSIESKLGVPVNVCDAKNKDECSGFMKKMIAYSAKKKRESNLKLNYGDELEEHLLKVEEIIKNDKISFQNYTPRLLSVKLLQNDKLISKEVLNLDNASNLKRELEKIKRHLRKIFGNDYDTVMSDKKHGLAAGVVKESLKRININRESRSDRLDKVLTNKYVGIPIFLLIIFIVFQMTFTFAKPFVGLIELCVSFFAKITSVWIASTQLPAWVGSLISDGIIGGVGSVIVFLPNIFIMFFLISLLEDFGYLARAAFIMDELMHKIGLHGKSFIPLILGFGCNVPAIMSTRSLDNKKDKLLTILIIPFMSCSARLPVYILFVGAFFIKYQGLILFSLYLLGILLAISSGLLFKKFFFKNETSDLILEIPPYRLPTLSGAVIHTWERGKQFIYKAGTLILSASIVVWFFSNLPLGVAYASEDSLIGQIGKFVAPILAPLGFGFWQAAVALIFGVVAKEVVVSTFATIYGVSEGNLTGVIHGMFTPLSAYAFMVMTLIYIPCVATITTIKTETGSWMIALMLAAYTLTLGWVFALIIYRGGLLLGFG